MCIVYYARSYSKLPVLFIFLAGPGPLHLSFLTTKLGRVFPTSFFFFSLFFFLRNAAPTTFLYALMQQIISVKLLLILISTYYLNYFFAHHTYNLLRKYCGHNISLFLS